MGNLQASPEFVDSATPKISLSLGIILVIAFGLYVFYYAKQHSIDPQARTLETFLTARKSVGWQNIGWSLYASAVGSGAITAPAEFGFFGGILGVFSYALATALPVLMIAFLGPSLQEMFPTLLSLSDFVHFRFGPITQVFVVLITLLNMSAAAIAEYTTLASLYGDFVGINDLAVFFIILVAVVTLSYTAYGGLQASIITDRAQAAVSVFLVQVVVIFLVADFDRDDIKRDQVESNQTPSDFEFTTDMKGLNNSGYSSLFTLPLSLITATIFSEAMWQRSWAAESTIALKKGGIMAFFLIFCLVTTFGSCGVLVAWSDLIPPEDLDTFNSNLYAFYVFRDQTGKTVVASFIGVLMLLLATTLSEGALDSLQNGIEASVSGAIARFFDDKVNLRLGRCLLVLLNIPLIVIGLQKFSILSVFLLDNMICVCAFFPMIFGFIKNEKLEALHRDWIPVTSFLITLLSVIIYAEARGDGVKFAFWENTFYEYEYFLFSFLISLFYTSVIYIGLALFVKPKVADEDSEKKVEAKKDIIASSEEQESDKKADLNV